MMALTREIIAQVVEDVSWTARAKLTERVATRYVEEMLDEAERQVALEVFRIALYDGEPVVRRVLAESLKHATDLPRDIVLGLARDLAEVASPFLAASPLLADEDLIAVVATCSTAHRLAVAARRTLSSRVAERLCRIAEPSVLRRLLANEGAQIGEAALHDLLDRATDPLVLVESIARRRIVPVGIVLRVLAVGSRRRDETERLPLMALATSA
jgi:uncharacterized protein (DUF2336 family)